MKFTHKPTVVEATQWLKPGDHRLVRQGWKRKNGDSWMHVAEPTKPNLNLGGWLPVNVITDENYAYTEVEPSNWVVEYGNGRWTVVTDEIFCQNYAQVVDDQQTPSVKEFADAVGHVEMLIQYAHEQGFGELGYDPLATILSKQHISKGATGAKLDGRKSTVEVSSLPDKVHPDDRVIRVEISAMFDDCGEIRNAAEGESHAFWSVHTRHADCLAEWHSDHVDAKRALKTSRALALEYGVKRRTSKITLKHLITNLRATRLLSLAT